MPAKFDRCVKKVRRKGVRNPFAVCNAAMKKTKKRKK